MSVVCVFCCVLYSRWKHGHGYTFIENVPGTQLLLNWAGETATCLKPDQIQGRRGSKHKRARSLREPPSQYYRPDAVPRYIHAASHCGRMLGTFVSRSFPLTHA